MDIMTDDYIKGVVEAVLFISEKPVMLDQIRSVLGTVGGAAIKKNISELMEEYESKRRGITIVEIAGGYQMLSSPHYVSYVRDFFKTRVKEKLSRPSLETLAIVAYKQPVSRGDIEVIRGVNSDGVSMNLLDKGLIKIVGRKDAPGRPYIYGTTKLFLEYFGLKSLEDMPKLEEFSEMMSAKGSEADAQPQGDVVPETTPEVVSEESAEVQEIAEETPQEETQESMERAEESANAEEEVKEVSEVVLANDEDVSSEDAASLKQVMDEINKADVSENIESIQNIDSEIAEEEKEEVASAQTEQVPEKTE